MKLTLCKFYSIGSAYLILEGLALSVAILGNANR
jgi:hypothetical protein